MLDGSGLTWWKQKRILLRHLIRDKLKEKESQHLTLQTSLEDHGYQVLRFPSRKFSFLELQDDIMSSHTLGPVCSPDIRPRQEYAASYDSGEARVDPHFHLALRNALLHMASHSRVVNKRGHAIEQLHLKVDTPKKSELIKPSLKQR